MKKTLNTSELENQLAGSVFFRKPLGSRAGRPAQKEDHPQRSTSVSKQAVPHTAGGAPPANGEGSDMKEENRTATPNGRTVQPNGDAERSSVVTELEEGVRASKRPTERYSFEIFTDMKEKIEDIQYRYKKKTGKKLSASRIIREALEVYFKEIEEAI